MKPSKTQIASTWDKIAREHKAYRRKVWPRFKEFISKSKVLDIGCGNASYLSKQDVGVDISFEMCKLAKKNCESICCDAVFLPIKSKTFSKIISTAMLHHLPTEQDREDFLKEIKRVLKPKGQALITTWYRWQKRHLPKAIFTKNVKIKWSDAYRFYHLFSKRELARLASKIFKKFEVSIESDGKNKNLYLYINK